jgi:hypothetical protein
MMNRSLARLCGLAALCLALTQCAITGPDGAPDVVNPTIDQMDSLDQQWGLPKRVSRGSGKRYFNSPPPSTSSSSSNSGNSSSSASDSSNKSGGDTPAAEAAEKPSSGSVDPAVINNLR